MELEKILPTYLFKQSISDSFHWDRAVKTIANFGIDSSFAIMGMCRLAHGVLTLFAWQNSCKSLSLTLRTFSFLEKTTSIFVILRIFCLALKFPAKLLYKYIPTDDRDKRVNDKKMRKEIYEKKAEYHNKTFKVFGLLEMKSEDLKTYVEKSKFAHGVLLTANLVSKWIPILNYLLIGSWAISTGLRATHSYYVLDCSKEGMSDTEKGEVLIKKASHINDFFAKTMEALLLSSTFFLLPPAFSIPLALSITAAGFSNFYLSSSYSRERNNFFEGSMNGGSHWFTRVKLVEKASNVLKKVPLLKNICTLECCKKDASWLDFKKHVNESAYSIYGFVLNLIAVGQTTNFIKYFNTAVTNEEVQSLIRKNIVEGNKGEKEKKED